ncbi:hypothetical protein IPH92_02810 [Candidatus Kaiserbacteria bacterium]|nr:MAG: hypothetical protein IPH92_02810 [Candidatus Kaiserbacteria bacterium]
MKNVAKEVQNFFGMVGRLFKGKFWFPAGKSLADVSCLIVQGDSEAVPQTDPFWRDTWKWIVISTSYKGAFDIYFETDEVGSCMSYFNKISTPYVAMREGPRAIKVAALSEMGGYGEVVQFDVFLTPASEESIRDALRERSLLEKVTWI